MSEVRVDFYSERVVLDLNTDETRLLEQVFDRAARSPDGRVRDAGWAEVAAGLGQATSSKRHANPVTLSDAEMEIRVQGADVRMAFDAGIANEVSNEIESCIPEILDTSWYKVAEQIRSNAGDLGAEH